MVPSSPKRHPLPSDRDLVYIAETQRDAEALESQTGRRVKVRRRLVDALFAGETELYITTSDPKAGAGASDE